MKVRLKQGKNTIPGRHIALRHELKTFYQPSYVTGQALKKPLTSIPVGCSGAGIPYSLDGELAVRRHLYHLNRLLPATVFAKMCIFFNDLCTVGTFFGISFRCQRREHNNNRDKERNDCTKDAPHYRAAPFYCSYNAPHNTCNNKQNNISEQWIPLVMITWLSFLQITYANKWHCPAAGNLRENSVPFFYGLEVGLYLSELYKIR